MKKIAIALLAALAAISCTNHDNWFENNETTKTQENAAKLFKSIDPNQDWNMMQSGTVNITADADLDDIVKIQILTESPFGNEYATILNEAEVKPGQQVSMVYDAPNIYDQLFAACINKKGVYYIKAFTPGEQNVSFSETVSATRASDSGYPNPANIKLGAPVKSFNALRTEASMASEYHNVLVNDGGKNRYYDLWYNGSWKNDRLWEPQSATDGDWKIENGCVFRNVTESIDLTTLKSICDTYLQKTGGLHQTNGRRNNWESIAEGNEYFTVNNNYLVSNGTPVTLIPVQMNTTEGSLNSIYYYYFDPAKTAGMSSDEEVDFIKSLPKFKALNGYNGGSKYAREKEYLLPYYGENPSEGGAAIGCTIPKGYKIGFLNRKNKEDNMNKCLSGCVYGDGRLNYEVNHLMGHYFSAMDKTLSQHITAITPNGNQDLRYGSTENGMNWDSPRIGIFSANNRTYMCFEDGADCNFSDMIIEINKGTEIIEETMAPSPEAAAYTMCFEDRLEDADYDMNDLVIQTIRVSETKIQLAIVACGGYDKLQIQGLGNAYLCSKEVHQFFGYEAGETFINTERNKQWLNPVSEVITVDKSKRIEDVLKQISVRNLTTGKVIALPKAGEPPYAIIVPINFRYPLEGHNITKAYANFLAWAQDLNQSENWYLFNDAEETFPDMFTNR